MCQWATALIVGSTKCTFSPNLTRLHLTGISPVLTTLAMGSTLEMAMLRYIYWSAFIYAQMLVYFWLSNYWFRYLNTLLLYIRPWQPHKLQERLVRDGSKGLQMPWDNFTGFLRYIYTISSHNGGKRCTWITNLCEIGIWNFIY